MGLVTPEVRPDWVPLAGTKGLLGNVERFLQEVVAGLEPEPPQASLGRPRVLPALALRAGLLVYVLRGFDSQAPLWQLLAGR